MTALVAWPRTLTRTLRRMVSGRRPGGDTGTSLLELVVGMTIMSVFLGIFTGAVVMMNKAENKAEAVSVSATQLNQAFLLLDKTVRYAAAISPPGTGASGDWYVELRATSTGSCTQFQVDITTQTLGKRTWDVSAAGTPSNLTPPGPTPAFTPVASGISNGGVATGSADQPFVAVAPATNALFQQLTVNLVSPAGSGATQTTSRSSFTFSAVNSTVPVPTAPICQEEGRP